MNNTFVRYLLYAAAALAPLSHGFSQVIIQHSGAADPLTEGFTLVASPDDAALGPVFGDLGFDAWSINPRSGNEYGFYYYEPTLLEQQMAISKGWVLSANVRLLDHDLSGLHEFRFGTGSEIFSVRLSAESNGDITISGQGSQIEPFALVDGAGAYHEYALVYDSISETAALWVDGVERVRDIPRGNSTLAVISFGSGQNISHAHWNDITLTIVPEPATVALFAGIGALLIAGGVRWRRQKGPTLDQGDHAG